MSREVAARYLGVGATKFDEMFADGRMLRAKKVDGRVIWDRLALDAFFRLARGPGNRIDGLLSRRKVYT